MSVICFGYTIRDAVCIINAIVFRLLNHPRSTYIEDERNPRVVEALMKYMKYGSNCTWTF